MFPTEILYRIYGVPSQKPPESVGYDAIFKGDASEPPDIGTGSWLPGLRAVECDVDSYFKDVFAGRLF